MKGRKLALFMGCVAILAACCCLPVTATALPENRRYEMVSPVYKGGFGALHIEAVSADGKTVIYYSPGAFAGAPSGPEVVDYIARRGEEAWSTTPTMVPTTLMPYVNERDISADLSTTLALGEPGSSHEATAQLGREEGFLLHSLATPDIVETWSLVGGMFKPVVEEPIFLKYEGASPDFCHILFGNSVPRESAVLPEGQGALAEVYELDRGCDGEPEALRLVAVKNKPGPNEEPEPIDPECKVDIGMQDYSPDAQTTFNAIAADGHEIFFTTCLGGSVVQHQLFARLGGSRTIEISKPVAQECSEVPCSGATSRADANFVGASEDGSLVFFTTRQPLSPQDADTGNDLYMARIGCPEARAGCGVSEMTVTAMTQVSHDPNGEEAALQGVVRLAPNGTRVYFVARGDLLDTTTRATLESENRPVPRVAADNLYAYDTETEKTAFVADLCSGSQESGAVEDARCPSPTGSDTSLWSAFGSGEEQTAGQSASVLVFSTYAQLTSDDTDSAKDVYRYDAITGALERVSLGEGGADANGNNNAFDATIERGNWGGIRVQMQYEMINRAVSEDGSRVVFESSEPLSTAATNHLSNVYEWHEGSGVGAGAVSLISGGSADEPVEDVVMSAAGEDIDFVTVDGLVPQDTDGAPDVYDARTGGGFPEKAAPREPCSSDACQGPLTNPAPLLVPGSIAQTPGENIEPIKGAPKKKAVKPKKKRRGRHKKGKGKAHAGRRRRANTSWKGRRG